MSLYSLAQSKDTVDCAWIPPLSPQTFFSRFGIKERISLNVPPNKVSLIDSSFFRLTTNNSALLYYFYPQSDRWVNVWLTGLTCPSLFSRFIRTSIPSRDTAVFFFDFFRFWDLKRFTNHVFIKHLLHFLFV